MNQLRTTAAVLTGLATISSSALLGAAPSQAATPIPATGGGVVILARDADSVGRLVRFGADGRQEQLTRVGSQWHVADVSADGRRVLLISHQGSNPKLQVFDSHTKKMAPVQGSWFSGRFTKPTGTALLLQAFPAVKGPTPTVRADLTGRVKARFARIHDLVKPNPAGTLVVSHTPRGVTVNSNATGKVLRVVPNPRGYHQCFPLHFRDAKTFTAVCSPVSGNVNLSQVFSMSTAGGRPTALTSGLRRTDNSAMGFIDSWSTPKGQLVNLMWGCGSSKTGLVTGRTARTIDAGAPLRVQGSVVTLSRMNGCDTDTHAFVSRNLTTGKVIALAGGARNKGEILRSWALVDPMS